MVNRDGRPTVEKDGGLQRARHRLAPIFDFWNKNIGYIYYIKKALLDVAKVAETFEFLLIKGFGF